MLIRKDLLNNLLVLATEYLNSQDDHWITVKPHGSDSKGSHVLVKDGETPKQAIDRQFGQKNKEKDYSKVKDLIEKYGLELVGENLKINKRTAKTIKKEEMAEIKENKPEVIDYFKKEEEKKDKEIKKAERAEIEKGIRYTVNSTRNYGLDNGFSSYYIKKIVDPKYSADAEFITRKLNQNENFKKMALDKYEPSTDYNIDDEHYKNLVKNKTYEGIGRIDKKEIQKVLPDIYKSLEKAKEISRKTDEEYEKHRRLMEKTMNP